MEAASDSGDELVGSVDISLEYDDYPLDLISPLAEETTDHYGNGHDYVISDGYDLYTSDAYLQTGITKRDDGVSPVKIWESRNGREILPKPQQNGRASFSPEDPGDGDTQENEKCGKPEENCSAVVKRWCRVFLTEYHPMPEKDTIKDRLIYGLRLPPHGVCARFLTSVATLAMLWLVAWIFSKDSSLPGGALFSVFVIVCGGQLVGAVLECLRIPGFVGMVLLGVLCRNVPVLNRILILPLHYLLTHFIRSLAIIVFIARTAFTLSGTPLTRKGGCTIALLAFLPCLTEAVTVSISAHQWLGTSWMWAASVGLVFATLGSPLLLPQLNQLLSQHTTSVFTLLLRSAYWEMAAVWLVYSLLLAWTASTDSPTIWLLSKGFLQVFIGALIGGVVGVLGWYLPHHKQINSAFYRLLLTSTISLVFVFGSQQASLPGSGVAAILVLYYVLPVSWRKEGWRWSKSVIQWLLTWMVFVLDPLVHVLFGGCLVLEELGLIPAARACAVVLLGNMVRFVTAFLSVSGNGFTLGERLFASVAWIAKPGWQVHMTSYLLTSSSVDPLTEVYQQVVLLMVLTVIITAPLSAILPKVTGERLLPRKAPACTSELRALDPEGNSQNDVIRGFLDHKRTVVMFGERGMREVAVEMETVT